MKLRKVRKNVTSFDYLLALQAFLACLGIIGGIYGIVMSRKKRTKEKGHTYEIIGFQHDTENGLIIATLRNKEGITKQVSVPDKPIIDWEEKEESKWERVSGK